MITTLQVPSSPHPGRRPGDFRCIATRGQWGGPRPRPSRDEGPITADDRPKPGTSHDSSTPIPRDNYQAQHLLLLASDRSGTATKFQRDYTAAREDFSRQVKANRMTAFSIRIAEVQFGGGRVEHTPFVPAASWEPADLIPWGGDTPLGRAILDSLSLIRSDIADLHRAGVPLGRKLLVCESDGGATDPDVLARAQPELHSAERAERLQVFPVGIGDVVASFNRLSCKRPAAILDGDNIEGFYAWLYDVLAVVSVSQPTDELELPPTDGWRRMRP